MKLVRDVSQNWKEMDGSSISSKKINAYLSDKYIAKHCLSDECLSLSERIADLREDTPANRGEIKYYLKRFFWGSDQLTDSSETQDRETEQIMKMVTDEK